MHASQHQIHGAPAAPSTLKVKQTQVKISKKCSYPRPNLESRAPCAQHAGQHQIHGAQAASINDNVEAPAPPAPPAPHKGWPILH